MTVWDAVDRLVDGTDDPAALRAHGLHLLAARRWRALGRPIPPALLADERAAAIAALAAPALLARVRATLDGPLLLLKGPEVAARYPDPALRPSGDVDLLVPDAAGAERALRAAGFAPGEGTGAAARHQHQPPLRWPTSPLSVEVHHTVPGPPWASPPPTDALLAAAVPASVGVDGILTLPPAHHALLLAAHAWRHYGPRPRLRDLVDVAIMAEGRDPAELAGLARAWGLHRVWAATARSIDALMGAPSPDGRGRRRGRWAGVVERERTVAEEHLVRWAGGLWAPRPLAIPGAVAATVGEDVLPWPGEPWPAKLARLGRAARNAFAPVSRHHGRG